MTPCILVLVASLVSQTPKDLGWTMYSPTGAGFSIAMPGKPDEGRKGKNVSLLVSEKVCIYHASQQAVPKIPRGKRGEIYDSITEDNVSLLKGTLVGEKEITISGVPGREVTIDGNSPTDVTLGEENPSRAICKMRFAVSGERQYMFFVEYPAGSDSSKEAKVFLESAKIKD